MKKIFTKYDLIIIGFLSVLFSMDFTFAQNPGNALDFNGEVNPNGRYGFVNITDAPPLNMINQLTIEAWFKPSSSSFAYKKLITIDHTKVSSTLTDFPLLVSVVDDELKDTNNGGEIQQDGDDILFVLPDGTKLSHEIEEYDGTTGKLVAWVKIPSLSSITDTEIYLYYGNTSCSSQQDAANVWDSNYQGVWHLNEATDETNIDATGNTNDGTPQNSPASTTGKIDRALDFDGAVQTRLEMGTPATLDLSLYNNWTISAWVNPSANYTDLDYPLIYSYGDYGASLSISVKKGTQDGLIEHRRNDRRPIYSNSSIDTSSWNHVVIVYDPDTTRFYLNGTYDGFGVSININQDNNGTYIGGYPGYTNGDLLGIIDEVRVSNSSRDSSWIATGYRNQNSPETFMSFSSQSAAGISKSLAYGLSTNNSKVFGTINNQSVSSIINAGQWNHISLTYDKDAGGSDEIKLYLNGIQSATGDYSTAISTNSNDLLLGDMIGFIGKMDEIRLWNDVRTQIEIRENMHITLSPESEPNLVAYWKLDETSGTLVMDSKGSNHGTMTNMADSNRVTSTAVFGGGIVNSTSGFTSGTINLGTFSLTTTEPFDNPVDIISTEILNTPNIQPSITNPLDDRYWVVEVYGTPGSYTADVTFTLPTGYLQLGDESNLVLYGRSSTSDSSWQVLVIGASGMTSTTVTFNGVSTLGQFTLGSTGSPLPVELLSFSGTVRNQKVYLNWTTATEVNNYGFEIFRRIKTAAEGMQNDEWDLLGFVNGHGNSNSVNEYSFIDNEINSAGIYHYRLKQIDSDGAFEFSNQIEDYFNMPIKFELSQNYPNPFNPSTTVSFSLPKPGTVTLKVYNLMGEQIKTLLEGYREAGIYTVNFNAEEFASGMYLYRLNANDLTETKKMLLMK